MLIESNSGILNLISSPLQEFKKYYEKLSPPLRQRRYLQDKQRTKIDQCIY